MKLSLLLGTILLTSGLLASQVQTSPRQVDDLQGIVREPSGVGIPAARVELRDGERVLVATQTNGIGEFHLTTTSSWTGSWQLHIERLGYTAVTIPVAAGSAPIEIILAPAPLPLPGLIVEGEGDLCEARENSSARRIWERASLLHPSGLDTLGLASYTWMRTDTLGSVVLNRSIGMQGSTAGQRASASLLRLSWTRRVEQEGYAFSIRRSDPFRSYDSWSYPPLEADFSSHFVSESFGSMHDFHIDAEDDDGWILRFCGRRTNRPYLEGTLTIGPDTLIQRAEWEFFTPDPDENSGGWAEFFPSASDGAPPYLLPIESLTWVSLPDSQVVRKAHWYQEWVMAPGDSVPFLPERTRNTAGVTPEPTLLPPPSDVPDTVEASESLAEPESIEEEVGVQD